MSFAAAVQRFAAQAAGERQSLSPSMVQPYTGAPAYATADGGPVCVFLSATERTEEITDNGIAVVYKAQLRVQKTCRWLPVERGEFVRVSSGERFRVRSATGADSAFAAEIVCDVVRISP